MKDLKNESEIELKNKSEEERANKKVTTPKINKVKENSNVKTKQNQVEKPKTRARGSMYGLASLKRVGDVKVLSENDVNTVKSNFILGPLTLKVQKMFLRNNKRELRSATATTSEMRGRITLRISNGSATLRSIKVQQPKQVKILTPSNGHFKSNQKTRELVWKKNYNLAQIVVDKLKLASRSITNL